jgi:hypothetical protein
MPVAQGQRVKGLALALPRGAMAYPSAADSFCNIGLAPLSPAAVCPGQILAVPGLVAFPRKIAAENRQKMKLQAVVGIDGSWRHR